MNETNASGSSALQVQISEVRALIGQRDNDAAMAICDELLRQHPANPLVQEATGDVYAARNLWPEALEWYQVAEESGGTPEIGARIAGARERIEAMRRPPRMRPVPAEAPDHFELRRLPWGIIAAIVGGALLISIIAVLMLAGGPKTRPSPNMRPAAPSAFPAPPSSAPGPATMAQPAPQSQYPAPASPMAQPPSGFAGATKAPEVSGPTVASAPVIITRKYTGPASDRDIYLAQTIGSLTWPDGRSMSHDINVMMDPYTGYAMISLEMPSGLQTANIQETVARQAYRMAAVVFRTDPGVDAITIRALALVKGPDKQVRSVVAFRGNTSRTTLEYAVKMHGEPDLDRLWREIFSTAWWNPGVTADTLQ